jgi:dihydroorotate dehydrogenase
LNPVINSFNLNSLGISDFINSYRDELKKFNELKNKVDEKKRMIEDIINKIESTELISEN